MEQVLISELQDSKEVFQNFLMQKQNVNKQSRTEQSVKSQNFHHVNPGLSGFEVSKVNFKVL